MNLLSEIVSVCPFVPSRGSLFQSFRRAAQGDSAEEAVFIAFLRFFMKCNLCVRVCKADLIDRGGGKWYALIVKVSTPHLYLKEVNAYVVQ